MTDRIKEIRHKTNDQDWPYSYLAPEVRELCKEVEKLEAKMGAVKYAIGEYRHGRYNELHKAMAHLSDMMEQDDE